MSMWQSQSVAFKDTGATVSGMTNCRVSGGQESKDRQEEECEVGRAEYLGLWL